MDIDQKTQTIFANSIHCTVTITVEKHSEGRCSEPNLLGGNLAIGAIRSFKFISEYAMTSWEK